ALVPRRRQVELVIRIRRPRQSAAPAGSVLFGGGSLRRSWPAAWTLASLGLHAAAALSLPVLGSALGDRDDRHVLQHYSVQPIRVLIPERLYYSGPSPDARTPQKTASDLQARQPAQRAGWMEPKLPNTAQIELPHIAAPTERVVLQPQPQPISVTPEAATAVA